jgi:hypothetical protein
MAIPIGRQKLTSIAGTTATEFRLPPPPKLRDHVSGKNIMEGFRIFDESNAQHWQDVQRQIAEHLAQIRQLIPPTT